MPRRKLNMLEPGLKMCTAIILCTAAGVLCWVLLNHTIGAIFLAIAGALIIALIVLLIIEQRQDHRQYLEAKRNDPDIL